VGVLSLWGGQMWWLLVTIVDLLDRNGSGWMTLGDRSDYERLETRQLSGKPTSSFFEILYYEPT
jgi:hypothetical protein